MSKLNEIIVSQLPIQSEVKPCTAYLLDNGDGTHDRYVSDEDGNLSKQAGGIKTIQAGENITIDNTDPKNPIISSTGGGSLTDTLESVVNMGNYSPKYMTFTGTTATPTRDGAIGMNPTTYSMYFGNMNSSQTGVYNLGFGYGSLQTITEGKENSIFGHHAFNKLTGLESESRWNIGIGTYAAQNLPKSSGNVFIGSFTGRNLSSAVSETDLAAISPAAVAYMKLVPDLSGYDATTQTFNTSLNTFVGHGINGFTSTATRAAMSTIIGASGLNNSRFRNFNNIIIGAGNYMLTTNATTSNSIIIGNSINLPNQVDSLAIGMNRAERINSQDAIIYGLLPNSKLTFNAPITVPSTYMRNAQGDSTYTKQLVAKPNGDIGWEDKSTGAKRWSDASIINTKLIRDTTKWILNFDIVNLPSGLNASEVKFYLVDRTAPEAGYILPQYYNLIPKSNGTVLDFTNIYNKNTYVDNINFTVSTYASGNIPSSIQTFFCDNIEFLFADNSSISAYSPATAGILVTIMLKASAGNSGQEQVQILQSYIN